MSSMNLHLPNHLSQWQDYQQNNRLHVLVNMPSGTQVQDLKKSRVVSTSNGYDYLDVQWSLPQILLVPAKVFKHSRFDNLIGDNHPKHIALTATTDKIRGCDDVCISKTAIKLPRGKEYRFTPREICGHDAISIISHGSDVNPTILCLFDLIEKSSDEGKRFSTKDKLEDDDELD